MQTEKRERSKKKNTAVITAALSAAVLIALLLTVYILFSHYYGRLHTNVSDNENANFRELAAIFRADLDADVSGYPDTDIHSARSAVVNEKISRLPRIDYKPIVDALNADKDADLSAYSDKLGEEDFKVIRWAIYYGFGNLLEEIEAAESDQTGLSSDTDKGESSSALTVPAVTPSGTTTPSASDTAKPSVSTAVTETEPPKQPGGTVTDADIYNVLMIGVDKSDKSAHGSVESIIIVSINRVSKRVIYTAVMKDTVVKDPENGGYTKIEAFYAKEGSADARTGKLIGAIKHNFDIDIHNYVVLDFDTFCEVIEIFGGVDVPLYYSEYLDLNAYFKDDPKNKVEGLDGYYSDKKNGYITVTLNSSQALRYVKMKDDLWNPYSETYQRSGDAFKAEREINVIKGIMHKMRKLSLLKLVSVGTKLLPKLTTDLSATQFISKINQYSDFNIYTSDSFNLTYTDSAWFPCMTNGSEVIFLGDPGYSCECAACEQALAQGGERVHKDIIGEAGIGIFEAPYRDGYALIKEAWRLTVYK